MEGLTKAAESLLLNTTAELNDLTKVTALARDSLPARAKQLKEEKKLFKTLREERERLNVKDIRRIVKDCYC